MSYGTTSQIINAQRLRISRGTTEVTLTSDVTVNVSRVVDRVNTRAGPVDTVRWALTEISFTAQLTKLLLTELKSDVAISAASAISYNAWTVAGLAISGASGDNTSDTYQCAVIDYEETAPESGTAQAKIRLRVAAAAV